MRFMRSMLILLMAVVLALPLAATAEVQRYESSFLDVFDTFSQLVIYATDKEQAQSIVQEVHDELLAYHRLYDIYNDYEGVANLKTVNDNAGVAPVKVDERLIDMVAFAVDMGEKVNGRTNIAMGSVLRLWHDCRTEGLDDPDNARLPDMDALKAANEHTNISQLVIDREASTLYLPDPEMLLDVGAVAKGYAVEQVAQLLISQGVESALLSIGGNVRAIGHRPDGTRWNVGVQNPDLTASQILSIVGLENASLVSSGSYQRFYTVDGVQYHHIIDPDTLMPATWFWGISIVTEDSGLADVLSTALYTMPLDEGLALVEAWDGVEALWVNHDGSIVRSSGFAALEQPMTD